LITKIDTGGETLLSILKTLKLVLLLLKLIEFCKSDSDGTKRSDMKK